MYQRDHLPFRLCPEIASAILLIQDYLSGNWQRAIKDAQAVLQYDPRPLTAWYRFGISLISAKMPAEAIDVLETALTLDPS